MVERRILFGMKKHRHKTRTHGHTNDTTKRRHIHYYIKGGKTTVESSLATHNKTHTVAHNKKNDHRQPAEANRMKLLHKFHINTTFKNKKSVKLNSKEQITN